MFEIKPLPQPETVTVPGGVFTLTHSMESLVIDPRQKTGALVLRKMKGFLDQAGNFQDFGAHEVESLDATAYQEMIADTTSGKKAGAFRTDDITAALTKAKAPKT